jgi:acetyl esterase/lipase
MSVERAIDPTIAAVLAQIPVLVGELTAESLPAIRAQRLAFGDQIQLSDDVERVDHTVPGPEGGPDVVLRVHTPTGLTGPLPCVYSIHGGGYVLGTYEMEDLRFDQWCPRLGIVGVSVEYRLAPETPYPGPLEDCYAGLAWVFDHADELGIDRTRVGIAGASAGGGLAAGLALLTRDRGQLDLAFQMLIYPMIDDRRVTPSSSWDVPIWSPANNEFGWRSYLGPLHGTEQIPPYAAATRATDLTGLPPAFVCVGTMDGFCDEDIEYAQRLNHVGVPTELHVYPGAPHGFDGFAPTAPLARRCRREMREWLAAVLGVTEAEAPATAPAPA